jgi:hypothetical protein
MSTEAVLVEIEDDEEREERENRWMERMAKIHACVIAGGLFDDGPSEAALQLARELARELTKAVDDYLKP